MAVVSAEIRQQAEALVLPLFAGLIEGMLEGYLLAEGRTPSTLAFVARMRENQVLEDRKRVDVVAQILQRNADAAAARRAAIDPALTGIARAQSARTQTALDKQTRFRDRTVTMRQMLDTLVAEGGKMQVRFSAPKLTRTQYNRMDNREQSAWNRKVLEKGLTPEYELWEPDGTEGYTLNKTEFDYADRGEPLRIRYDYGYLSSDLHEAAKRVTREKYPAIFARETTDKATAPAPVKVAPAERYTYDVAETKVSYPWIIEVFGADAFEPFNLIELSNYLEGRTDTFEGDVSRGWWEDGLRSLGAVDAAGKVDFPKVRAAYLAATAPPASVEEAPPAERFTYAATLRPITDAFLFEARGLYDPKYPYFDEIPARYGERAQRHGIVSVNQRLPLDFQRHMDLRLITADGPPSIQREVANFIDRQTQEVVGAYVRAFPDEKDLNLFANDFTRQIQDAVREQYGATDAVELVPEAVQRAIESVVAAPAPVEEAPPEPSAAEPVEQPHQPDPEPAMGAYGEYLATLPDKQRQKVRAVLDSPYMMRESSKDEPIKGARHAIVEQLLDRQRSMPYRPLEPGKSIGDKSGPLLLNFYGFFKVKPEEHAYALWLYDRLIAAEKDAKNGVDRRVAEPLNYGAIIEGEANRIFALHTQVALD